jgi:hypothetical protein
MIDFKAYVLLVELLVAILNKVEPLAFFSNITFGFLTLPISIYCSLYALIGTIIIVFLSFLFISFRTSLTRLAEASSLRQ